MIICANCIKTLVLRRLFYDNLRKTIFFYTFAQILLTMVQDLIGRKREFKTLKSYLNSDKSEFVAVYGRRRVGKTFLIRKTTDDKFAFFITGVYQASKTEQLTNFAIALQKHTKSEHLTIPKSWILAFYELSKYLGSLPAGNKVIFIDELPWMDTAKAGFIAALENFWNSWASLRNDIKLIVCGSATSWMINNLIRSRGGLHNRLTHHLVLEPFNLSECEEYFKYFGFNYSRKQVAECYMAIGGIPYYMSMMDKSKSLAQNIDLLFFMPNAPLKNEFNDLYRSLFKNATPHIEVVAALATKSQGLSRKELLKLTHLTDNGAFSLVLDELEQCGFIRQYEPFKRRPSTSANKRQNSDALYQLLDFYTLFYFQFIKNNSYQDEHFWTNSLNSPMHHTWCGLSFEKLCLVHLQQIKAALGIAGVQTMACTWRSHVSEKGAQIDLMIDRKDDTINICEIKYAQDQFEITKDYEANITNKLNAFRQESGTRKTLHLTFITTYGVKQNSYSNIVQSEITLDDIFKKLIFSNYLRHY